MIAVSKLHRRAAALALISLAVFGALVFQPMPMLAQDKADVQFSPVPGSGFNFKLSPDGRTAATFELGVLQADGQVISENLPIRLFDVTTGKALRMLEGATDYAVSVAFSGDGTQLASIHRNGDLNIWTVSTGKLVKSVDTGVLGGPQLQFVPPGRALVEGIYDAFRPHLLSFDAQSGAMTSLAPHFDNYSEIMESSNQGSRQNTIDGMAVSPDGKTIAVSTATTEVWLVDVVTKSWTQLVKPDQQLPMFSIRKLAFTADGRKLVYFNDLKDDSKLHVWDITDSTESVVAIGGRAWALAPDGDTIAWANKDDTTVHMAKISAPDDVTTRDIGTEVSPQPQLEFTQDGKRLVLGLWNPGNTEDGTNGLYVLPLS